MHKYKKCTLKKLFDNNSKLYCTLKKGFLKIFTSGGVIYNLKIEMKKVTTFDFLEKYFSK